jgi:hypothetical protein
MSGRYPGDRKRTRTPQVESTIENVRTLGRDIELEDAAHPQIAPGIEPFAGRYAGCREGKMGCLRWRRRFDNRLRYLGGTGSRIV